MELMLLLVVQIKAAGFGYPTGGIDAGGGNETRDSVHIYGCSMNFLAHLYLSGDNDEVRLGNFVGDFVKGAQVRNFGPGMQAGIYLHRFIDQFTDEHQVVRESKLRLRNEFGHYAPVIVDVFYDHFLAKNWLLYHQADLKAYTEGFYRLASEHKKVLPERANYMLRYMSADNWLYHYQFVEGIRRALSGMARRTSFESGMERAHHSLEMHYEAFGEEFAIFFPELVKESGLLLEKLRNDFSL